MAAQRPVRVGRQRDRRDAVALGMLQSVRVDDESSASSEPWVGVGADGLIVEGRLTALGLTGDERPHPAQGRPRLS